MVAGSIPASVYNVVIQKYHRTVHSVKYCFTRMIAALERDDSEFDTSFLGFHYQIVHECGARNQHKLCIFHVEGRLVHQCMSDAQEQALTALVREWQIRKD